MSARIGPSGNKGGRPVCGAPLLPICPGPPVRLSARGFARRAWFGFRPGERPDPVRVLGVRRLAKDTGFPQGGESRIRQVQV